MKPERPGALGGLGLELACQAPAFCTCLQPREKSEQIPSPLDQCPCAGVQPRLIQGIRSGDGVGDLFIYKYLSKI